MQCMIGTDGERDLEKSVPTARDDDDDGDDDNDDDGDGGDDDDLYKI